MDVLRRELQEVSPDQNEIRGINPHTVNSHRQNILQKLSVNNSMEAVQTATAMMLL